MRKLISVVLPCHNEEKNLPLLIPEVIKNIPPAYDYEILLIDDGSFDKTYIIIRKLAGKNKRIKGIRFYKNFGHQEALIIGIKNAKGAALITMDSDFQHPPDKLPKMISLWEKGHDVVFLQKKEDLSSQSLFRTARNLGYRLWSSVSDGVIIPGVSNFSLIDRSIADYITQGDEHEIFLRGLIHTAAAKPILIPYKVAKRKFGDSSYNFNKKINLFINGLISFSTKPLRIAAVFGLLLGIGSLLFLVIDWVNAIFAGRKIISGYLTIVFLMLIMDGFIIFYLGVLGEYIGVIFKEVKKRPQYMISEKINI